MKRDAKDVVAEQTVDVDSALSCDCQSQNTSLPRRIRRTHWPQLYMSQWMARK